MSPILFNIALAKVVKYTTLDKEAVKLGENNIGILAYADDIVFIVETKYKFKEQLKNS